MTEYPNRTEIAQRMRDALASSDAPAALKELLRSMIVAHDIQSESENIRILSYLVQRLDTMQGDAARLVALATDFEVLLRHASSVEEVESLLELVAERERFSDIVRKYLAGVLSRSSFLSFITEQRWPASTRRRLSELSEQELVRLMRALSIRDFRSAISTIAIG